MQTYPDSVELEDKPCPNGCDRTDEPVLESVDRLHHVPGKFSVVRCRHCLLIRTNPRPTPSTIGAYYPDDYAPYRDDSVTHTQPAGPLRAMLEKLLGLQQRRLPPIAPGRLLEVGCASGQFLLAAQLNGWQVEGIEFSETAASNARQKGLRVQTATIDSAAPPQAKVDVVAAWMVLEHLHEPVKSLQRLRNWVKDDGYLVASVPDASSWEMRLFKGDWYALQVPTHLFHFTPASLAETLSKAGWHLEHVTWQRNSQNLLHSLEAFCTERKLLVPLRLVAWIRSARKASKIRLFIGWILGSLRQSGRIEIRARPMPSEKPAR